jgi:hypothetical protein
MNSIFKGLIRFPRLNIRQCIDLLSDVRVISVTTRFFKNGKLSHTTCPLILVLPVQFNTQGTDICSCKSFLLSQIGSKHAMHTCVLFLIMAAAHVRAAALQMSLHADIKAQYL